MMKQNVNFQNSLSGKELACSGISRQFSHQSCLSTQKEHTVMLIPSSNAEAPEFQKLWTEREGKKGISGVVTLNLQPLQCCQTQPQSLSASLAQLVNYLPALLPLLGCVLRAQFEFPLLTLGSL